MKTKIVTAKLREKNITYNAAFTNLLKTTGERRIKIWGVRRDHLLNIKRIMTALGAHDVVIDDAAKTLSRTSSVSGYFGGQPKGKRKQPAPYVSPIKICPCCQRPL